MLTAPVRLLVDYCSSPVSVETELVGMTGRLERAVEAEKGGRLWRAYLRCGMAMASAAARIGEE